MNPRSTKVYLNVYKLDSFSKYNPYLVPFGLGAYHTGIEVYGDEISFGFHDEDTSGIFTIDPRTAPGCQFVFVNIFFSTFFFLIFKIISYFSKRHAPILKAV